MKKIILSFIFFSACIFSIQAQTLFGLTGGGGANGGGALIKFIPAANNLSVARSFENGAYGSQSGLIQASDGKLYGTTSGGGSSYNGVIVSYDPSTSTFAKLKSFSGNDGAAPSGSLVQASNGKLYGTTNGGGSSGNGVIFSFDPSSSTYTKLTDFDGANGSGPTGGLVQTSDGKLYGMTNGGGSSGYGVIFSYDPSTSAYKKLMDFGGANNGARPSGSLVQANDGKLYGMTTIGGKYMYYHYNKRKDLEDYNDGYGVIFSFNPKTSAYKKLVDFDLTNGAYPRGSLMQASNGSLYGMTEGGGSNGSGVIFSCDLSSNSKYTKLIDFVGVNGSQPAGSLMQASNGKLYGTANGGSSGDGVIFSFNPSSSTYITLKNFEGTDGTGPRGNLLQAGNGKLYGTTSGGGISNSGIIFSFDPSSSTYTKLRDFGLTDGSHPVGGLVQANGKLYGTTSVGGSSGNGVIFSFDPSSSTYTKVKDFGYADNAPSGSLVQASNGKLYGLMSGSSSSGNGGAIFSFDPSSSTYTKPKFFGYYDVNGSGPSGSLIQASDGKLYGMTYRGGSNDYGVIFSFDPSTSIYTKLQDFNGTNGTYPSSGSTFIELNEALSITSVNLSGKNSYSSIEKINNNKPVATRLTVAPNPIINSTSISFAIQQPQHASLKIFDVNGKMIQILANKKFEKGQYKFQWNTDELSAGIYFLRFDAGSFSETKKLSVLK